MVEEPGQGAERVDQGVEHPVENSGEDLQSALEKAADETGDPTIQAGLEAIQTVTERGEDMTDEELAKQGEAIVDALVAYAKVRGVDAYTDLVDDLVGLGDQLGMTYTYDAMLNWADNAQYEGEQVLDRGVKGNADLMFDTALSNAHEFVDDTQVRIAAAKQSAADFLDRGVQGNAQLAQESLVDVANLYQEAAQVQADEGRDFVERHGGEMRDVFDTAMALAQEQQELLVVTLEESREAIKEKLGLNQS